MTIAIRENLISDYWISLTYIEGSADKNRKLLKTKMRIILLSNIDIKIVMQCNTLSNMIIAVSNGNNSR